MSNPAEVVDVLFAIMAEEHQSELVLVLDGLPDVSCDDIAKEIRRRKGQKLRKRSTHTHCRAVRPHRA
jgi:hypothetical protein